MARHSLAFVDAADLAAFNQTVYDMLGFILAGIKYMNGNSLDLVFEFEKTGARTWRGRLRGVSYRHTPCGDPMSVVLEPFLFNIPEGGNIRQSFEMLFWDVAKLAFAMTKGNVQPSSAGVSPVGLSLGGNDAVTLPFAHLRDRCEAFHASTMTLRS